MAADGAGFAFAAAAVGTPLLMKLWSYFYPRRLSSEFEAISSEELKRRNDWIDHVGVYLSLSGIFSSLLWYAGGVSKHNPWPVGMAFGLAVVLPFAFFACVTLPCGAKRFKEFLHFYQVKYRIGMPGLLIAYVPLALLGVVSAFHLVF